MEKQEDKTNIHVSIEREEKQRRIRGSRNQGAQEEDRGRQRVAGKEDQNEAHTEGDWARGDPVEPTAQKALSVEWYKESVRINFLKKKKTASTTLSFLFEEEAFFELPTRSFQAKITRISLTHTHTNSYLLII